MKVYEGAEGWGLVGIFVIAFRGHRGAGRTARPHAAQSPHGASHPTWVRSEGHESRGGRDPWPRPRGHDCPEVSEGKQAPLVGSRSQDRSVRGEIELKIFPWPAPTRGPGPNHGSKIISCCPRPQPEFFAQARPHAVLNASRWTRRPCAPCRSCEHPCRHRPYVGWRSWSTSPQSHR